MSKIKIGYVVATPEVLFNENLIAYQGDTEDAFKKLRDLGYEGAELMLANPDIVKVEDIQNLSQKYGLDIPGICTGEVCGQENLTFMDPDEKIRLKTIRRMKDIIDFAEPFGAYVNIGRIRGRFYLDIPRNKSLDWMYSAFNEITDYAKEKNVVLILEPIPYIFLNNINTTQDGIEVVKKIGKPNFRLMMDFFSMHMEDKSFEKSFLDAQPYLKHIHVCDSNRLAPGYGNIDFKEMLNLIKKIDYSGYISIEINHAPDKDKVMKDSIELIRPLLIE